MIEALFYKPLENGRVQCTLCPRYCKIKPGQHGFCYVRKNIDGKLYSLSYSKPFAINVDPIEKKPLFHVLPGTKILSLGTAGCNMACKFCQNWDLSKAKLDQQRAMDIPPFRIVQMALHYNTPSLAYTYNEPTVFAEYVMEIAKLGKEYNLKNVMVTNGYITPEAIPTVYANIDAANVDLKAFNQKFYSSLTLSKLEPVLNTLKILKSLGIWIEITNLIIPNHNDSLNEITSMCEWILTELGEYIPLHFTAFHPDYKLTAEPPTKPSLLLKAQKRALEIGLKYVYVGNIAHPEASNTYCHNCKTILIQRDWYRTQILNFQDGRCQVCGESIPGIFA